MSKFYVLGVDPGKRHFAASLLDGEGQTIWKNGRWPVSRAGFDDCLERLKATVRAGDRLTVGIEATAALDDNLLAWFSTVEAPFSVTPIRLNSAATARFSGPSPIRGKTDGMDANVRIGQFTQVYAARLRRFEHDPQAQAMARLVGERQRLVKEASAAKNRLGDRLVISFPEFATVFEKPWLATARAVLRHIPTARHAAGKRPRVLARLELGGRKQLGLARAKKLTEAAKRSVASATEEFDAQTILFLLGQLDLLEQRIGAIEKELVGYAAPSAASEPREPEAGEQAPSISEQIRLLQTMRGVGAVGAATVVLASRGISRFASAKAFSAQLGACPDLCQTGSSKATSRLTPSGDRRTRATLFLLARMACIHDPAFAFHKWRLMREGRKPKQALCACMNRLARIMWTLTQTAKPYDVNHALEQIAIHHSGLWKTFLKEKSVHRHMWTKIEARWKNPA